MPTPRYQQVRNACSGLRLVAAVVLISTLIVGAADATGVSAVTRAPNATAHGARRIVAIGAENEYANVISQIGGRFVDVSSVLSNPNTDPHTFESSPSVAREVSTAALIVQNGVGYDTFMNKIEAASPSSTRRLITVQNLLGLPTDTSNPHLWYDPTTLPKVAGAVAAALSLLDRSESSYFAANLKTFDRSFQAVAAAIATFKSKYHGITAATTEPVADYLLSAMGIDNLTPFVFQADVMNGVDPSPQDVSLEEGFFTKHQVKVFCYNEQVVDTLTTSIRALAEKAHVPVVGVYETMPTPGYDVQSWMLAEIRAIQKAVTEKVSTERL